MISRDQDRLGMPGILNIRFLILQMRIQRICSLSDHCNRNRSFCVSPAILEYGLNGKIGRWRFTQF